MVNIIEFNSKVRDEKISLQQMEHDAELVSKTDPDEAFSSEGSFVIQFNEA